MSNTSQPSEDSNIRQLTVELGDRSYPIWIGADVSDKATEAFRTHGANGAFVVDSNVLNLHNAEDPILFPIPQEYNGETAKSMELLGKIYEFMANQGISRDGFLIALGGGVTGDLGGFAAASYLRGIDFYQIPTTLLAMVDSSVGGKTGINIAAGKNLVGAFWQPKGVFISTQYLKSLPDWEFSAGMAEVIKYGMLYDRSLYDQLINLETPLKWNHPALPDVIYRCCEIKAGIVKDDEKETASSGGRALLNLGHTFAHAIENVAGYGSYLHGEAVAIGLDLATRLSQKLNFDISNDDLRSVRHLLQKYNLPYDLKSTLIRLNPGDQSVWTQDVNKPEETVVKTSDKPAHVAPPKLSVDKLLAAMKRDKKVKGGKLRFVAMKSIGKAVTVDHVDESLVRELWLEAGAVE